MKKFSEIEFTPPDLSIYSQRMEEGIADLRKAGNAGDAIAAIDKINKLNLNVWGDRFVIQIRFQQDVKNEKYKKDFEGLQALSPRLVELHQQFVQAVLDCAFKKEIEADYGTVYMHLLKNSKQLYNEHVKNNLLKEAALIQQYNEFMSTAPFIWDGNRISLYRLMEYRSDADRNIRKKAAELTSEVLTANRTKLEDIFSALWEIRSSNAHSLGFDNTIDYLYRQRNRIGYGRQEIQLFAERARKYLLPIREKELERQSRRLGLHPLNQIDTEAFFIDGAAKLITDVEGTIEAAAQMYRELSPDTDRFYTHLIENEMLDYKSMPNKMPTGFACYLFQTKTPFIFSSFHNTPFDIMVLTHEFGHAFQFSRLPEIKSEELLAPLVEQAEIHSSSMELLTLPWMHLFFGKDDVKFRYQQMRRGLDMILTNSANDSLQEFIYSRTTYNAGEIHAEFKRLNSIYYPSVEAAEHSMGREGTAWLINQHLFLYPFYMIDYALAQMVSFQLWLESLQDFEAAWNKYLILCRDCGSCTFEELVERAGLISPFKEEAFVLVANKLRDWFDQNDKAMQDKG